MSYILTEIAKEAACHVMLVHHFGKNVSLGPRGHTCFFAACDTVIAIKKEKTAGTGTIEVMKQECHHAQTGKQKCNDWHLVFR